MLLRGSLVFVSTVGAASPALALVGGFRRTRRSRGRVVVVLLLRMRVHVARGVLRVLVSGSVFAAVLVINIHYFMVRIDGAAAAGGT